MPGPFSDFQMPNQRRFRLFNQDLHLDPELQILRVSKSLDLKLNLDFITKEWHEQMFSRMLMQKPPPAPDDRCAMSWPLIDSERRAGEIGDIVSAVTSLPPLACAISDLKDRSIADLRRMWNTGPGERTVMISFATVFTGTAALSLQSPDIREFVLGKIHGTYTIPGLLNGSFGASLDFSQYTATKQFYLGVTFDLGRAFPNFMGRFGFGPADSPLGPPTLLYPGR